MDNVVLGLPDCSSPAAHETAQNGATWPLPMGPRQPKVPACHDASLPCLASRALPSGG